METGGVEAEKVDSEGVEGVPALEGGSDRKAEKELEEGEWEKVARDWAGVRK